jgi:MYXO-CTERM domain-containing protein
MKAARLVLPPLLVIATASTGRAESYVPEEPEELDLLIVVDTSAGMADELAALAPQLGALVEQLSAELTNYDDLAPSLHVGVVSADLGAGPHALPGCVAGGDGAAFVAPFLYRNVSGWGDVDQNFEGSLAEAVADMVPTAADGCVVQQPLAAARRALDGTVTDNVGFLRPTAALAVLVITNQEDCSTGDASLFDPAAPGPATSYRCAAQGWTCTPPIDGTPQAHAGCYVAAVSPLDNVWELHQAVRVTKGEPWRIAVGVVRGPSEPVAVVDGPAIAPSCGGDAPRAASPALRVDAYANLFDHRFVGSICEDTLGSFADAVRGAVSDPGPGDSDGGWSICDGGGWDDPQDAGDEGGFPGFGKGGGCATGGGDGGGVLLLLALGLLARRAKRKQGLAVDL